MQNKAKEEKEKADFGGDLVPKAPLIEVILK